jgi:flagellar FliL protein
MAEETAAPQPKPAAPPAEAKPKAPPLPFMLIGVVAGALLVGAAAGAFMVGPMIAKSRTAKPPAVTAATQTTDAADQAEKDEKPDPKAKPAVYRMENLIVNPSGSQGTRFLMATVALEVPNERTEGRLREHEVEVRDAVTTALESQTLEMLTQPGARDTLKRRIATAVGPFAGGAKRVKVFLPQFVIQ